MIERLFTIFSAVYDPYHNIALEELLLHAVAPGEVILYLWQNQDTVVIGRNQNARAECRVERLEQDGGHLARRLSGGGAVFHDLGNLNFTFLARRDSYDRDRQAEVILQAARLLGLQAEKTGRNDIAIDGRKFSGNAFYTTGDRKYHHGTLLLDADLGRLQNYLTVDRAKLQAHGVQSVQARVVNLCQLDAAITVPRMRQAMVQAFGQVYGLVPQPLDKERIDQTRLETLREKFASPQWRLGAEKDFTATVKQRFAWGGAELGLQVSAGVIAEAVLYTDALDDRLADVVQEALTGCAYHSQAVARALGCAYGADSETTSMVRDIAALVQPLFQ